jgi:hypothetical protein
VDIEISGTSKHELCEYQPYSKYYLRVKTSNPARRATEAKLESLDAALRFESLSFTVFIAI